MLAILMISGCAETDHSDPQNRLEPEISRPVLRAVTYADLPGWEQDDLSDAQQAFRRSCEKIMRVPAERPFKPVGTYGDWHHMCAAYIAMDNPDNATFKFFIEHWLTPYEVTDPKDGSEGLFTGYYEPLLHGSHTKSETYATPIYARPDNMFIADLGLWHEDLAGKKITGLIEGNELSRVPERAKIEEFGMEKADVLVWVDDPVQAFFLHIQGSGLVQMDDGSQLRVGYAAQNGHPYFAVGRALIERGALTKENVSLQTIRAWMQENPQGAQALMNLNPSYIFFRILESEGPEGAQGVPLTAERSLAVDKNLYSYGMPVWLDAQWPVSPENSANFQKLLIAQDTGGAIRGVVRGDVFWGHGERAEYYAGHMKSKGSFWMFLPKKR